jgi:hypothetical protein
MTEQLQLQLQGKWIPFEDRFSFSPDHKIEYLQIVQIAPDYIVYKSEAGIVSAVNIKGDRKSFLQELALKACLDEHGYQDYLLLPNGDHPKRRLVAIAGKSGYVQNYSEYIEADKNNFRVMFNPVRTGTAPTLQTADQSLLGFFTTRTQLRPDGHWGQVEQTFVSNAIHGLSYEIAAENLPQAELLYDRNTLTPSLPLSTGYTVEQVLLNPDVTLWISRALL